ncbi:MAG: DNA primase catalytic subunit PriS [Methanosarcinales archaeon]|nr:MAG: DNA primase catalytic subunit PriS [Methanosarcinales archaeon]
MQVQTKEFLRNKFKNYYNSTSIQLPPHFEKREWGFIFFDESYPDIVMRRHKSFTSEGEAVDYIKSMVPAHVFHSSAYYSNPSTPTMKEKGWQGADLIFDLDADHLNLKWTTYGDMLQKVKDETLKLIDFLLSDFGFDKNHMRVVFSGGRGYHIHVRDPNVIGLESPERREIVDYITGLELELDRIFGERVIYGDAGRMSAETVRMSSYRDAGWRGRINRWIVSFLVDLGRKKDKQAVQILKSFGGIGDERALEILRVARDKGNIDSIKKGNLDVSRKIPITFWRSLVQMAIADIGVKTDEPVTADTKRLIRLPTSLHGGSSFRVTPLTLDTLKDFNPLRDAVVFGDESVGVNVIKASNVKIKGEEYRLRKGKQKLPEHLAVFLMCRGAAEYES